MLTSLYIKNYALIDSLEIDFNQGFSVITGETGAGKSIILGALSLILGQRADSKSIKQGEAKCVIEGHFDVSKYDLKAFCDEKGIEYDPHHYILRREVHSSGKSRAFINDTPVTLNELKDLGGQLIDIHSQHQNLLLGDLHFQMQIVDALAGNKMLVADYQKAFAQYRQIEKSLSELQETLRKSKEEEDYLRFQYQGLCDASMQDQEQEQLEQEQEMLSHAEDIKAALYRINHLLSADEHGVVSALKEAMTTASSLAKVYARIDEAHQRIETAYIDLKDLASEMERMANDVEFNPDRLSFVASRLDQIYSLQKKHHLSSISELIGLKTDLEQKLEYLDSSDQELSLLEKELESKHQHMLALAKQLTQSRQSVATRIQSELMQRVAYLGMPNVQFQCQVSAVEQFNVYGKDQVLFLFSANKNAPLQPVSGIASGGEISRIMLCLKAMVAGATALPSIVFDEIDTGVSGEIADKMGQVMLEFGQSMQVMAITHLPQIAAKGKTHYKVYKEDQDGGTTTKLAVLSDSERLEEIARMLSGSQVTDAAIENARDMLGLSQ